MTALQKVMIGVAGAFVAGISTCGVVKAYKKHHNKNEIIVKGTVIESERFGKVGQ